MSAADRSVVWSVFTDTQRRRAEALLLTSLLFPLAPIGASQRQLAEWVIYGKWETSR